MMVPSDFLVIPSVEISTADGHLLAIQCDGEYPGRSFC